MATQNLICIVGFVSEKAKTDQNLMPGFINHHQKGNAASPRIKGGTRREPTFLPILGSYSFLLLPTNTPRLLLSPH